MRRRLPRDLGRVLLGDAEILDRKRESVVKIASSLDACCENIPYLMLELDAAVAVHALVDLPSPVVVVAGVEAIASSLWPDGAELQWI